MLGHSDDEATSARERSLLNRDCVRVGEVVGDFEGGGGDSFDFGASCGENALNGDCGD